MPLRYGAVNGQHPRSPAKVRDEFSYLEAEAGVFNSFTDDKVVRDWAKRFNVLLDQLASHIGEELTPDRLVITAGAFKGGFLSDGWARRLKVVVERSAEAVTFLSEVPEGLVGDQPTNRAEPRPSTTGAPADRLHPHVQEVTKRFPPAGFGDVAVLEACKHLAQRIREMSGLGSDDKRLIERAFSLNDPKIRLNALDSRHDRAEQQGVLQIASGLWLAARDPRAHRPAGECNLDEIVELLTIVSYVHRRLDAAVTAVDTSAV